MKNKAARPWAVVVADHAGAYTYGPFETKNDAESWREMMRNAFYGRIVHVVPVGMLSPYGD